MIKLKRKKEKSQYILMESNLEKVDKNYNTSSYKKKHRLIKEYKIQDEK